MRVCTKAEQVIKDKKPGRVARKRKGANVGELGRKEKKKSNKLSIGEP